MKADIKVDPAQGRDTLGNAREVEKAMATIAEKSIVNPNATLTAAPPPARAPPRWRRPFRPRGAGCGRRAGRRCGRRARPCPCPPP